ncbi:MAG: HAD family hydrolase [Gammaproteobacteria bacterium]|nr:MAG: HAD family hydrolase [Gammaproteobacteria bacterium]
MKLAIFDLDNTLLDGDSDQLWGEFIAEKLNVDIDAYKQKCRDFYQDYLDGNLNVEEFLHFSLKPLAQNRMDQLMRWRREFVNSAIVPIILPKGIELINEHRNSGRVIVIITATNSFVTRPIADKLHVTHLLATEPEIINGKYSGRYVGTPTFKEGKITALEKWVAKNSVTMEDAYFYSDSHNDIPLLEKVDNPVAVDPDDQLQKHAAEKGWQIISLR